MRKFLFRVAAAVLNSLQLFRSKNKRRYRNLMENGDGFYLSPTRRQSYRFITSLEDRTRFFRRINSATDIFEGGVCVDIGANLGYWSIAFERFLEREKTIFALEPLSENFSLLARNTEHHAEIQCIQLGISEAVGRHKLGIPDYARKRGGEDEYNTGLVSVFNSKADAESICFVEGSSLIDTLVADSGKVFLIKIDVEGFELQVMKGLKDVIKNHEPLVILEVNPTTQALAEYSLNSITQMCDDLGYEFCAPKDSNFKIDPEGVPSSAINALLCPGSKTSHVIQAADYVVVHRSTSSISTQRSEEE